MGLRTLPVNTDYWIIQRQTRVYCALQKGNDVTGGWWKRHNQELSCFQILIKYYFCDQIKKKEMS